MKRGRREIIATVDVIRPRYRKGEAKWPDMRASGSGGALVAGTRSTLEDRVYRAMLRAGWKPDQIETQKSVGGGRLALGGLVVDMVLYRPSPLPIKINGNYWHRNPDDEIESDQKLYEMFGTLPVTIWGDEADDDARAYAAVVRKIGMA